MNLGLISNMVGLKPDDVERIQAYAVKLGETIDRLAVMADKIESELERIEDVRSERSGEC